MTWLGTRVEREDEKITATKLSPSDVGSVLNFFDERGLDPFKETPCILESENYDDSFHPRPEEKVENECKSSIEGIQAQMLVELSLISHTIETIFPGNRHLLNGELTELIEFFYRNQTDWKRDLFSRIFHEQLSGRTFVYSLEELEEMEDPTFEDYFGYVGGGASDSAAISIRRAFIELRQHHVFYNYNRRNTLVEPYEGIMLPAERVMDIWFTHFDDEDIAQIIKSVSSLLSNKGIRGFNSELSRVLDAVSFNSLSFEPVTIQQLGMSHPNKQLDHRFIMHLSAMTDILIPAQQVVRPSGQGLYFTPPIMIDVKTGRQIFNPTREVSEKEEIETLAYILAVARSRVAQDPKAKGSSIRTKAGVTDVQNEMNTIAMRPWHYCRLYHFNPITGEVQNLMPLIFLPDRVREAYINEGRRLPLTNEEQREMYDKLYNAYEKLVLLSDWIRLNKRKKPWKKNVKQPEYILPKLMKPGQKYETPVKQTHVAH